MAPRRNGRSLWGYAPARCGRLCEIAPSSTLAGCRLYVTKDGSPTRRPALPYGASTPRLMHVVAGDGRGGVLVLSLGLALPLPASGHKPVQPSCGNAEVGHVCFREQAAPASLACRESWRGHGCALGFMAATFQRKQFPRRCAASSRDKFFWLPGSPLRFDRKRCCPPIPRRPVHNKDAMARPCSTRKEKHHG